MDQIINWMQNNWFELGTLVGQFTLLFAGLWFAGKILSTMRATQQQMGALLRLSMSNGLEERSNIDETEQQTISGAAHETTPSVVASSMFSPTQERPTSYSAFEGQARTETPSLSNELSGRAKASAPVAGAGINRAPINVAPINRAPIPSREEPTPYAAAPLTMPEDEHSGGHLSAAVQWLQTPMPNKRNGVSPLKKIVRWLQAPARS
ncbi:MAG TPA: hypothetical protein VJN89_04275 [Candidatus Acidoferrum sp.]|nr:hypothetical protein [Candidatus Acidoferrum sp.]